MPRISKPSLIKFYDTYGPWLAEDEILSNGHSSEIHYRDFSLANWAPDRSIVNSPVKLMYENEHSVEKTTNEHSHY